MVQVPSPPPGAVRAFPERLLEWTKLKEELAKLQQRERAMRQALFSEAFPSPTEGTNSYELPAGYVLKGKYPIERKVDETALDWLRTAKVQDLDHTDRFLLAIPQDAPPDALVHVLLRVDPTVLLKWEPSLVTKEYRALTEEQRHFVDRVLIIKPGSIGMEIADPPKRNSRPQPPTNQEQA